MALRFQCMSEIGSIVLGTGTEYACPGPVSGWFKVRLLAQAL